MFFPGLHGDARTWAPVMAALPDVASTALDLPAVADLDALVDEVAGHVEPGSVVVGHSLGGVVVMHLAERHSSVLAGLVLVTAPVGAEDPESARARGPGRRPERGGVRGDRLRGHGGHLLRRSRPRPAGPRGATARRAGVRAGAVAAHSVAIGAWRDRWELPAQAPCPVPIVGASDDQVVPTEEQRRWAEKNSAPHVAFVEIPETGHMLPVEDTEQLSNALSDWLSSLEG
ncbi:MAG: alpha/beta hydrolase [Dietzia psychralcaliphila]